MLNQTKNQNQNQTEKTAYRKTKQNFFQLAAQQWYDYSTQNHKTDQSKKAYRAFTIN